MRHTLRETWSGLRRNATMTLAVIVTMWVSLSLFGAALLATQQVDLLKGKWYDKVEVSVFLCVDGVSGAQCSGEKAATQAQKDEIRQALQTNPQVSHVYYESKHEAFQEYQRIYADSPVKDVLTEDTIQDSYRVKLVDPQQYEGVVTEAQGLPGVQSVVDLHNVLDPIFLWMNALKCLRQTSRTGHHEVGRCFERVYPHALPPGVPHRGSHRSVAGLPHPRLGRRLGGHAQDGSFHHDGGVGWVAPGVDLDRVDDRRGHRVVRGTGLHCDQEVPQGLSSSV